MVPRFILCVCVCVCVCLSVCLSGKIGIYVCLLVCLSFCIPLFKQSSILEDTCTGSFCLCPCYCCWVITFLRNCDKWMIKINFMQYWKGFSHGGCILLDFTSDVWKRKFLSLISKLLSIEIYARFRSKQLCVINGIFLVWYTEETR